MSLLGPSSACPGMKAACAGAARKSAAAMTMGLNRDKRNRLRRREHPARLRRARRGLGIRPPRISLRGYPLGFGLGPETLAFLGDAGGVPAELGAGGGGDA